MHAASVLQKCLPAVFNEMHVVRARALIYAVQALLTGRRLILMDLARAWPGAERVRAPLKCLDRLLSNRHVQAQREALYTAMTHWLIRRPTPLILIDWSDLHEDGRWQLLRAAIPVGGRTITILELVFPESMKGSPRAEKQLLRQLQAMLPHTIKPILVTDAGFRTPWFRAVAKQGWHYVGRLRCRTRLQVNDGLWFDNQELYRHATSRAQRWPAVKMVESHPWTADLVLYQKARRGRLRLNRHGERSRAGTSLKAAKRERDPLLLVISPSLRAFHPRQLVSIYATRRQIEQSFRDLKCHRFGCAFSDSLTRKPQRIAMLLLIHALATFVAWLAALSQTRAALTQYGGIVSPRVRPHYSVLRIGWEALRRRDPTCTPLQLRAVFIRPPTTFLTQWQNPS